VSTCLIEFEIIIHPLLQSLLLNDYKCRLIRPNRLLNSFIDSLPLSILFISVLFYFLTHFLFKSLTMASFSIGFLFLSLIFASSREY